MALMIPESISSDTSEAEQLVFGLLHQHLPPQCTVWHRTALELEDSETVPFLALGDEIGIVVITPLELQLADSPGAVAQFWQRSGTVRLTDANRSELKGAESRAAGLRQLLLASQLSELVGQDGLLQPAFHSVCILARLKGPEINRLRLRSVMEDALVLGQDELPQLYNILRQHTRPGAYLTGAAFNAVRLVVSPSIEVHLRRTRRAQTVEGAFGFTSGSTEEYLEPLRPTLDLQQEQVMKSYASIPEEHEVTARDLDARLLRGVVGSGKSLILLHRAKFLAQFNPKWRILLLTYNRSLADFLRTRLQDLAASPGEVEIIHFHAWCRRYLFESGLWRQTELRESHRHGLALNVFAGMDPSRYGGDIDYWLEEFDWIRDQGFIVWEQYADAPRKGREQRLVKSQRKDIWYALQAYRDSLRRNNQFDWEEVPLLMLEGMQQGVIPRQLYHAILVDEAQDFAPSWFAVIQEMLRPTTNMLFIAADATQKIYRRSMSWRALGINVTGNRSRILNRCYRNTYEILRVAYELVGDDLALREELRSEGDDVILPELDSARMRRGPVPIILEFADPSHEVEHIAEQLLKLKASGYEWDEIAVIHRDYKSLGSLAARFRQRGIPVQVVKGINIDLAAPDVKLLTLHSSKGLEFSVVFVAGVERLQPRPGLTGEELAAAIANERRLVYVGATRARERLYITHAGPVPTWAAAALAMAEPSRQSRV